MAEKKPTPTPDENTSALETRMKIEWWPIDRPKPYPRNARKWSAKAIEKLAQSIRTFGWVQPIVCDVDDVICIGHLRQAAARYLGETHVPVHVASDLSPNQIKALRIADNRTHEESDWDSALLSRDLIDLKIADFNLDITGFDTEEVAANVFGAFGGRGKAKGKGKAQPESVESYEVVVACIDETQQAKLLERLAAEGFECRALISTGG